MNEPPPVLHKRHDVFLALGVLVDIRAVGVADLPVDLARAEVAVDSQSTMLTGKTTGRIWPPESAPATDVASAEAVNWLMPSTRANVVSKFCDPTAWTPWALGGIDAIADPSGRARAPRRERRPLFSSCPVTSV